MSAKLAVSNACCPELDLNVFVEKAKQWGYDGVEIAGLHGHIDLGLSRGNCTQAAALAQRIADAGLTLAALNTGMAFANLDRKTLEQSTERVSECVRLAAEIGCRNVIVAGGPIPAGATRVRTLECNAEALRRLAELAASQQVFVLLENAGDLASSQDTWFLHDAVGLPALRICFNPLNARRVADPLSVALPRLAGALQMVTVCDARLTANGDIERYTPLSEGHAEIPLLLELLRGVAYGGWLCVRQPADAALGPPETVLPAAAEFLRSGLDKPTVVLTAYKGDKNAPRFASASPTPG